MRAHKILIALGLVLIIGCTKNNSVNNPQPGDPNNPPPIQCTDEEVICNQNNYIFVDISCSSYDLI